MKGSKQFPKSITFFYKKEVVAAQEGKTPKTEFLG